MQIPDLTAAQARVLLTAGYREPSALMIADESDAARALAATLPAHMRKKRVDDRGAAPAQVGDGFSLNVPVISRDVVPQ